MSKHIRITCPVANFPVRTGYRARPGTDIAGPKERTPKRCPRCAGTHVWSAKDAFWLEYVAEPISFWGRLWQRVRRLSPLWHPTSLSSR